MRRAPAPRGSRTAISTTGAGRILDKLQEVARGRNLSPAADRAGVAAHAERHHAPIIGANTVEQLHESLGASGVKLSDEEMAALNDASKWE